jgi:hypothetical protein
VATDTVGASVESLYEQYIRPLSAAERLQLLSRIAEDLSAEAPEPTGERRRSILDFHGVGAKSRIGIDAQEYVNEIRREWDHRP